MALTTVRLLGVIGKLFTKELSLDISTPREALNAIEANYPGFYGEIQRLSSKGFVWRFLVGNTAVDASDLESMPVGRQELCLVPVISGSGAVGRILLGAALIGVGIFTGGTTLLLLGGSVALSGFSALFNPPKDKQKAAKQNYLYNGAENTIGIGQKMPIVLGRLRVGSMVISADIVSYQI